MRDKITLKVLARMIYLLGYWIFWSHKGSDWQQARDSWNEMAEELGLRAKQ